MRTSKFIGIKNYNTNWLLCVTHYTGVWWGEKNKKMQWCKLFLMILICLLFQEQSTYFGEALSKWVDLNCTQNFGECRDISIYFICVFVFVCVWAWVCGLVIYVYTTWFVCVQTHAHVLINAFFPFLGGETILWRNRYLQYKLFSRKRVRGFGLSLIQFFFFHCSWLSAGHFQISLQQVRSAGSSCGKWIGWMIFTLLFCSLLKEITPKTCMLYSVLINSVLFNNNKNDQVLLLASWWVQVNRWKNKTEWILYILLV